MKTESVDLLFGHFERLRPSLVGSPQGFIKYPYLVPGGYYQESWDWDGFFIACHFAGRTPALPQYLKYWALNFMSAVQPNGDIPGCISVKGPEPGHRAFLMKPFLAQGIETSARLMDDYSWVKDNYSTVVKAVTRREEAHYIPKFGLFVWDNAMQSGADNNPALSNDPSQKGKWIACDVNAFIWREYIALSRIASKTGHDKDAEEFHKRADSLQKCLITGLWDEKGQSYWNKHVDTGAWNKRVSYSNFVPLWAGMVPREHARAMIRRYLWNEEHLLSQYGLRSLSKQDPAYNNANIIHPYSNWQGPIWPIAMYFYFMGLVNYGFTAEADKVTEMMADLYLRDFESCGSLHENYDADTGKPLAPSAAQSKDGTEGGFIGWNLLLQDMIEFLDGKTNPSCMIYLP